MSKSNEQWMRRWNARAGAIVIVILWIVVIFFMYQLGWSPHIYYPVVFVINAIVMTFAQNTWKAVP